MDTVLDMFRTLYESLWITLILAFLFSIVALYADGIRSERSGWRGILELWLSQFRSVPQFRRRFFFYLYTAMMLYQTLLGRKIWEHPLQAVFGNWRPVNAAGDINLQILGNLLIFTPFIVLLFRAYTEKMNLRDTVWSYLLSALKITAAVSFSIEILQAVLHLGTLQISDFCYNVLGGVLGGLIDWCGYALNRKPQNFI